MFKSPGVQIKTRGNKYELIKEYSWQDVSHYPDDFSPVIELKYFTNSE